MFVTLVPAYGTDYKSQKQVREAWNTDKDFMINDMSHPDNGRYINRPQAKPGTSYNIRYKKLTQICVIKVK